MVEGINPLHIKLAQLMGEDPMLPPPSVNPSASAPQVGGTEFKYTGSPFEDMLGRAVDSLEKLSGQERVTNQLINSYVRGEADLQDVMVQSSKLAIQVQLAVTVINLAVTTFKEITQMQV